MDTDFNTTYTPNGSWFDAPAWMFNLGQGTIRWSGSQWEIVNQINSVMAYNTGGSAIYLPPTGWVSTHGTNITLSGGSGLLMGNLTTVSISPGSSTIASGNSVTLTATGATSYTWSNGTQSSIVITNITSATTLSVTGITGSCIGTASASVSLPATPAATSMCVTGGCPEVNGTYVDSELPAWQYMGGDYTIVRALKHQSENTYMLFVTYSNPPESVNLWVIGYYNTETDSYYDRYYSAQSGSAETVPTTGWEIGTEKSDCSPITVTAGACVACSLTVAASPSSPTITSGGSVTLTASGATSYTWSNGSTQNPLVLTNVTSATAVSVTGTTGQCSATAAVSVSVTQAAAPCVYTPAGISIVASYGEFLGFSGPSYAPAPYAPDGTQNGVQSWSNQFGYRIRWSGSRWEIIHTSDNTFAIAYNTSGSTTNLPCTGWTVDENYGGPITLSGGCGSLTAGVSVSISPSSQTITSGGGVTLTASGATSYTWSNGSTANPLVLNNVTSATTLSVTGVAGGCSATASAAVSVTAAPGPVINVGPLTGTATACYGTVSPEMTFTVSGTNLSTAPGNTLNIIAPSGFEVLGLDGYADQIGLPIYDDGTVPPTTVSVRTTPEAPAGSLSGTLTLSSSGATTRTMAVSATIVSVTAGITGNSPVTPGGSVTLTASGATSYRWSNGATTNPLVLTNVASATTLSVTGTTGECSATASAAISLACDPAIIAHATSMTQSAVLGTGTCSVQLTGTGFGTGYTISGPDGYVFSAVYRKAGTYTINGLNVRQPGTYTFKVGYQNACGEASYDIMTYVVTGTACK